MQPSRLSFGLAKILAQLRKCAPESFRGGLRDSLPTTPLTPGYTSRSSIQTSTYHPLHNKLRLAHALDPSSQYGLSKYSRQMFLAYYLFLIQGGDFEVA